MSVKESPLRAIWNDPKYKEAVQLVLERDFNNRCLWCGRVKGDEYTDNNWKRRVVKFITFHHTDEPDIGLSAYKRIAKNLQREWERKHPDDLKVIKTSFPPTFTSADARKRLAFKWAEDHRVEINSAYNAHKEKELEAYRHPSKETGDALCDRCHAARGHGLVLCEECKTGYHDPRYPACKKCHDKTKVRQ